MKKLFSFSIAFIISASLLAQKQKEKNNKAEKPKQEARNVVLGEPKNNSKKDKNVDAIWDGTKDHDGGSPKASKNQPAKVRSAFAKDYPGATNVSWSKYRGDWTASFNNGLVRSVAVYHANGQRKDTRTVVQKNQVPKTIIDGIFKKQPNAQLTDAVKIESPKTDLYRIKIFGSGGPSFSYFDANGKEVKYDY